MKSRCKSRWPSRRRSGWLCLLLLLAVPWHADAAQPAGPSTAFYYGGEPPTELLSQFDWAVVEPRHIDAAQLHALGANGTTVFAYVSVGEIDRGDTEAMALSAAVARTRNAAWDSAAVDVADPRWQSFVLQRADALWQRGFHALFLDTLDSYQLFAKDDTERARQQQGLITLIRALHDAHPQMQLLLNRGFELLPAVHDVVAGVAAESLFGEWDAAAKQYRDVPAAQRDALLKLLKTARDDYHLPVVVIDYVAPAQREKARALAKQIADLGFVPWVSNGELDGIGVGAIETMPRKVLMLYALNGADDDVAYSAVHNYAALPLEYLGYAADYREIDGSLPDGDLRGRYAGIVIWLNRGAAHGRDTLRWLKQQVADGVPIAIVGDPALAFDSTLLKKLGLRRVNDIDPRGSRVVRHDAMLGFEGFPQVPPLSEDGFRATRADVSEHLLLEDQRGLSFAPVLTGPWGGIALAPWVIEEVKTIGAQDSDDGANSEWRQRWILDPFAFFRTALHLPDMPVPDATTENGSRYLLTHIDGDGFASRATMAGTPYVSEVIRDHVLKRRQLPTTVSVIEGEVSRDGLYPKDAPRLEAIARDIFRLPNVEIATHTYSHPFDWLAVHEGDEPGDKLLPIPGYRFSMKREIEGSADYIDRELAPPGKKTRMVLWSGNALPREDALTHAAQRGLLNINGGNTSRNDGDDTLTAVSPMTRPVGAYTQVYAPVINENVYTNGYKSPLWGFRAALDTYALTDTPRRLKPIGIYYHFYSATHRSSLDALDALYDYAQRQQTLPLYASDYVGVVQNFADVGVARRLDGSWQISGATALRTLRLPAALGQVDLADAPQIAGVRELPQGRYVALSGASRVIVPLRDGGTPAISLRRANGRLVSWQRSERGVALQLRAEVPLQVELAGIAAGCAIAADGAQIARKGDVATLSYARKESGHVAVTCH